MILKKLTRLYDVITPSGIGICRGLSIRDHLLIKPNKINEYLIISKCQFSKIIKSPYPSKKHISKLNQTSLKESSPILQDVIKYNEIWNTPIKESEHHICREKFDKYIKLLGKLNEVEALSFLPISKIDYNHFDTITKYKDKIFEMAVLLKVSPDESFKAMLKYHFLSRSRITTLKKKVAVVTGSGIEIADLRRDLWVLSYTEDKLQARIEKVKALNLPIKCWMLHCKEEILDKASKNREQNKAALLPFVNNREYLCNRLKLNDNQLISFSRRHPAVLKVKTAKLRGVLDYLLSEGFSTAQIYSKPRILCHSITTIKNRMGMLRDRNYEPRTLSLLCMTAKTFEIYLQKLGKPNETCKKGDDTYI